MVAFLANYLIGALAPAEMGLIMDLQLMYKPVVSKVILALVLSMCTISCGTVYELYAPPGATINPPQSGKYENPDVYLVPSQERKIYVATKAFSPPNPRRQALTLGIIMVDVEVGETWKVTHKIKDRLVIHSAQYQARQERSLSGKGNYLYCLLIAEDGRINKGWFLLRDPKIVVLASERMTIMDPSIRDTEGWPDFPVFQRQ